MARPRRCRASTCLFLGTLALLPLSGCEAAGAASEGAGAASGSLEGVIATAESITAGGEAVSVVHATITSDEETNDGRSLYMMVRPGTEEEILTQTYDEQAALLFDDGTLHRKVIFPGHRASFDLEFEDGEQPVVFYFFFTHPEGDEWILPVGSPLPRALHIELGNSRVIRSRAGARAGGSARDEDHGGDGTVGWVIMGVGLAAALVGGGFGIDSNELYSSCQNNPNECTDDRVAEGEMINLTADILMFGGLGVAVVGLALGLGLELSGDSPPEAGGASASLGCGPAGCMGSIRVEL